MHWLCFADAATILAVESSKNTCHMFQQSGKTNRGTYPNIYEILHPFPRKFTMVVLGELGVGSIWGWLVICVNYQWTNLVIFSNIQNESQILVQLVVGETGVNRMLTTSAILNAPQDKGERCDKWASIWFWKVNSLHTNSAINSKHYFLTKYTWSMVIT